MDQEPDRLHETGLIGSLRWWYEVLVRGLGGRACDPTVHGVRCPDQNGRHCVVCELFGCTGWARKFRLMVLDENGEVIQKQIQAGQTFILRFIPLRPIAPEEWCLLDATLRLIADYGAMGGKTVFKPSDESGRENAPHHRDFGLITVEEQPGGVDCTRKTAEAYVRLSRWRRNFEDSAFSWASLQNFWCVKGRYLKRQDPNQSSFNKLVGRNERKHCKACNQVHSPEQKCPKTGKHPRRYSDDNPGNPIDAWLAGRQQESKKVFSFKHPAENGRTFGFVKPGLVDFNEIKRRLGQVWSGFNPDAEFQTGQQILNQLFHRRAQP
ncbi:MAG: type III-B CRISPR module RAMP protein Cmr1 [Chloroflexi bacterium]|nr:type III-B CRISPR module RAMP protein Cmr1 [Chloroflexota bacterium]